MNQKIAKDALEMLEIDGASVFSLSEQEVNRMLVCGVCPRSGIHPERTKRAFRSSLDSLLAKVERYEGWWDMDPGNK